MDQGFRIDLHVHTRLSGDSLIEPAELAAAARACGLDAVCMTEHHRTPPAELLRDLRAASGFTLLGGCEYSAREGHLLIYGVTVHPGILPPHLPMQEAIDRMAARGGVAVAAHPFQHSFLGASLGERVLALTGLAALETRNGSAGDDENARAAAAAAHMILPGIGGSDAHGLPTLGRAWTRFAGPVRDEGELCAALRHGEYAPGREL